MENERELWKKIEKYREISKDCEISGEKLTKTRIIKCLDLFEQLIKFLGIFKDITAEIRQDLIEAIFSKNLSADKDSNGGGNGTFIERVPYFGLYDQELVKKSEIMKDFNKKIEKLEEELARKDVEIVNRDRIIVEKDEEIARLNDIFDKEKEGHEKLAMFSREQTELNSSIQHELESDLTELREEKMKLEDGLRKYKLDLEQMKLFEKGYENLNKKFANYQLNSQTTPDQEDNKENVPVKFPLDDHTESLLMMSNDILILENVLLDDFDNCREDLKKSLLEQSDPPNQLSEEELFKCSEKLGRQTMEYSKTKSSFVQSFSKIQEEKNDFSIRRLNTMRRNSTKLEESKYIPEAVEIEDMYTINESRLNMYAAVVRYSTNYCETFYDCPELSYCSVCQMKTVICPHNNHESSITISLPDGCSHLKIVRPALLVKHMNTGPEDSDVRLIMSDEFKLKRFRNPVSNENVDEFLPFEYLIYGFETRKFPRKLSENNLYSIFEDFWGDLLANDELGGDIDETHTTGERLQLFFGNRYKFNRAGGLAHFDYLNNIIEAASYSQLLRLFCHILLGNIDASIMRYLLLINECIDCAAIDNEDEFRFLIKTIYPFLEEDEVDNLALSYISSSENHFSQENTSDFLTSNLLKLRDPHLTMLNAGANEFSTNIDRVFSFKEYQVLLDSSSSLPDKKLSSRLFKELERVYQKDGQGKGVPLSKVIQIVAFLSFFEKYDKIKLELEEYRESVNKSPSKGCLRWTYNKLKRNASILKDM